MTDHKHELDLPIVAASKDLRHWIANRHDDWWQRKAKNRDCIRSYIRALRILRAVRDGAVVVDGLAAMRAMST